ncbi:response regulator [Alteromonas sp. ASW11-19]|uniref:Response regulator n=1 Tax=Alteromonas salexigens TaxID=2982530 RepID=A0ABT2VSP5_9ALTE|nr:response regulator [Alteromonas salexigens]MCU7555266.1 response regulator [Alteromonas salexigens]
MNIKLARQMKVLIVDDQVLAKGYLKYSMEELGFQDIEYVDRASLALSAIRREKYDLILCAYDLKQEQEGYFLYDQLKEQNELPPSTAFVFISADTTADIVHSIVELQPDEFLAKPFTVKDLDRRLSRVLQRKQALKPVYDLLEHDQFDPALNEIEQFLTEPKNAEFFPLALKIKGELLQACNYIEQAKEFYQAILNVQNFTWAQLGLVRCYIQLNQDEDAEKLILKLAFEKDSMLAAYDLLSALQIKLQEFDDALECVSLAGEISPRNIHRHRQAVELSRLTHDYETQFEAAKKVVKFAKNSIHDKPDIYLNVARAGIDFAMTADEGQTSKLIKQSNEYLRQLKASFPKADIEEQIKVIDARLLYLQDESENARELLGQLNDDTWITESIEALLDKAKAFHEVGLQEHALNILDIIETRCKNDPAQSTLFLHYIRQERSEKAEIQMSPKALNNSAVIQYQQGDLAEALKTFRQAFTLMPKNPSIALNLLQATALEMRDSPYRDDNIQALLHNCMKTIESAKLNQEQERRYQRVKSVLRDLS